MFKSSSSYLLVQPVFEFAKLQFPLDAQASLDWTKMSIQDLANEDQLNIITMDADWKPAYMLSEILKLKGVVTRMIAVQGDDILFNKEDRVYVFGVNEEFSSALNMLNGLSDQQMHETNSSLMFFGALEINPEMFYKIMQVSVNVKQNGVSTINAAISDAEPAQPEYDVITEAEQNALDEAEAAKTVGRDYFLPTAYEVEKIYEVFYSVSRCVKELEVSRARLVVSIKRLAATISMKNAKAVANWDKENKWPFDNNQPYNSGTNDEKRTGIAHELFEDDYQKLDEIQAQVDILDEQLLEPKMNKELAEIEIHNIEAILAVVKEARLAGVKIR